MSMTKVPENVILYDPPKRGYNYTLTKPSSAVASTATMTNWRFTAKKNDGDGIRPPLRGLCAWMQCCEYIRGGGYFRIQ